MEAAVGWMVIGALFFGALLLPSGIRHIRRGGADYKGDGGRGDFERARAEAHAQTRNDNSGFY